MKAGTARIFDNEIPGGQFSNLFVQCKAMDLYDRWFEVQNMYRDVNRMFGEVVKVTPSSKVVGDLALFLIAQGLTTEDVRKDGDKIDYPESVVALFNGQLGYPHCGFPEWLSTFVLRGKEPERKGAIDAGGWWYRVDEEKFKLPALDFEKQTADVQSWWPRDAMGREPTEEDIMTSVLYPKVHKDYIKFHEQYGALQDVPSEFFWYGMKVGDAFKYPYPVRV